MYIMCLFIYLFINHLKKRKIINVSVHCYATYASLFKFQLLSLRRNSVHVYTNKTVMTYIYMNYEVHERYETCIYTCARIYITYNLCSYVFMYLFLFIYSFIYLFICLYY